MIVTCIYQLKTHTETFNSNNWLLIQFSNLIIIIVYMYITKSWNTLILAEHMCMHVICKSVTVLAVIYAFHNACAHFLVAYHMHVMFMLHAWYMKMSQIRGCYIRYISIVKNSYVKLLMVSHFFGEVYALQFSCINMTS